MIRSKEYGSVKNSCPLASVSYRMIHYEPAKPEKYDLASVDNKLYVLREFMLGFYLMRN